MAMEFDEDVVAGLCWQVQGMVPVSTAGVRCTKRGSRRVPAASSHCHTNLVLPARDQLLETGNGAIKWH